MTINPKLPSWCCCSVDQSCLTYCTPWTAVVRLPCPPLSPRVCLNSCALSWWCHSAILSSIAPFSSCPQSFPASRPFPMSWLFASNVQSIGASASILPMNIQGGFPLRLMGLISLLVSHSSQQMCRTVLWTEGYLTVVAPFHEMPIAFQFLWPLKLSPHICIHIYWTKLSPCT